MAVNLKAQNRTELETMKGIMAMLCAFAGLADLASRAPYPVRSFMLWLLRRAEAVAREWVDGPADFWSVAIRVGDDPTGALDLAASFRRLACAVRELTAQYRQFARRWHDDGGQASGTQRRAVPRLRHAGTRLVAGRPRSHALPGHVLKRAAAKPLDVDRVGRAIRPPRSRARRARSRAASLHS